MQRFSIGDKIPPKFGCIYWRKTPQAAELLKPSFLLISPELRSQPVSLWRPNRKVGGEERLFPRLLEELNSLWDTPFCLDYAVGYRRGCQNFRNQTAHAAAFLLAGSSMCLLFLAPSHGQERQVDWRTLQFFWCHCSSVRLMSLMVETHVFKQYLMAWCDSPFLAPSWSGANGQGSALDQPGRIGNCCHSLPLRMACANLLWVPLQGSLCRSPLFLLQKLNVNLTEVEKVLLPLQQLEDIGNSGRLDSLYWNAMRWLNHTYVCLASWHCACSGACLPACPAHCGDLGRGKEKGRQGSKFRVEFNGAPWLVGWRRSLMVVWNYFGLTVLCAYILGFVPDGKGL